MSASIQRIVATPLHAVAESNIGLAHLNFDFSLAKFEAPPELLPLGKQLSKARRQSAEDGSFHILARRLGVLFDDVLPDVPALLESYGTRASEIVQQTTQKLDKPRDVCDGFFGTHLGIDSTTIWASATSGKSVLRIHLLACILARIWSPQEATAIWAELVSQRQRIIKKQAQSAEIADNYLAQLAAAHEIERSSLGSWDASARAWLQVADQARRKEQVQAQLIVNNLSVAVKSHTESDNSSNNTNPYDSVLLNLHRALTTLDKLVRGEPQRITDGGILLGLISWHIYPDLVVLGSHTKEIHQQDPLVKAGGIVTISISAHASHGDGVYWSLPLASLRYYGTVHRERSTMGDSRISVAQLQALLLGASLGADKAAFTAAEILQSLWRRYYNIYQAKMCQVADKPLELPEDLSGFSVVDMLQDSKQSLRELMKILHFVFPFKDGIELLLSANGNEKKMAIQLMRYGSNYGRSWIGNTSRSPFTFFGLTTLSSLLYMAKTPGVRIQLLRDLCANYQLPPSDYVIRFRTSENLWAYTSIGTESFEAVHGGMKRKWDNYGIQYIEDIQCLEIPPEENWVCIATLEASRGHGPQSSYSGVHADMFAELLEENPGLGQDVLFNFAFGYHNLAAVYTRQTSQSSSQKQTLPNSVPLTMVQNLFEKDLLQLDIVAEYLLRHFESNQPGHGHSLLALGRVVHYYNCHLPQATVSMGVIKNPLSSWKWTQSVINQLDSLSPLADQQARAGNLPVSIYPSLLPREFAFAAILQFESGTIDVDVSDLTAVLAISSGNSLFIAEELLHDPIPSQDINIHPRAISHVMGNIGKPGIALLVSPPELEIREHDLERWQFVNHNPFEGELSGGQFEGTSLHLSFTGWEGPISLGSSSYRGMEAYFVEAVVSVNDSGDWVGDLDIFKGLRYLEQEMIYSADRVLCSHDPGFAAAGVEMVSIDCWEEILDPPAGFLVLRSAPGKHYKQGYGQWMVRLAAVGIAASRKYKCVCLPVGRDVCWTCAIGKFGADDDRKVLFVC
ncbi:hypothetical protein FE257_004554 [Aspergillus nanangensis]|uniref:Uncharacterized protein n=1 Tax=Aspergillus nanangensis TaxID=2582783 RepID=A0AAD4D067_ASPNN|nr:hypothetical protein FE257_004554 [Aspergillus nanangensis]